MGINDWEQHKLLIMQEVKDLKESQKEIREQLNNISIKVTILNEKALMGAGALSLFLSIMTALVINYFKGI